MAAVQQQLECDAMEEEGENRAQLEAWIKLGCEGITTNLQRAGDASLMWVSHYAATRLCLSRQQHKKSAERVKLSSSSNSAVLRAKMHKRCRRICSSICNGSSPELWSSGLGVPNKIRVRITIT